MGLPDFSDATYQRATDREKVAFLEGVITERREQLKAMMEREKLMIAFIREEAEGNLAFAKGHQKTQIKKARALLDRIERT